ncbi:MAG: hypothetical protein U9N82_04075, partial [Thermodesulfobacteriota bacterium]|nr:hypothetical protein [Thermodesulfobacteriota bacterium]
YLVTFKTGQTILLEGDDSQDLYILVSGEVDVIKGHKKITEISGRSFKIELKSCLSIELLNFKRASRYHIFLYPGRFSGSIS